jgi:hypothetical protein
MVTHVSGSDGISQVLLLSVHVFTDLVAGQSAHGRTNARSEQSGFRVTADDLTQGRSHGGPSTGTRGRALFLYCLHAGRDIPKSACINL